MTPTLDTTETEDYASDAQFTDAAALDKADRHGLDVLFSDSRTLQLDLDSDDALERFQQQYDMLYNNGVIIDHATCEVLQSKSGNYHVIVHLTRSHMVLERIMLQALLGSDIKREMLAYIGWEKGQQNPVLLFRPRGAPPAPVDDLLF